MSKKSKSDIHGFVYSTNPNFSFQPEEQKETETLQPAQQKLKIKLETKHRAGKAVTLIENFIGSGEDLEELEVLSNDLLGAEGQLVHEVDGGNRGALDHGNRVVGHARQDGAHRLRQDDAPQRQKWPHAEG